MKRETKAHLLEMTRLAHVMEREHRLIRWIVKNRFWNTKENVTWCIGKVNIGSGTRKKNISSGTGKGILAIGSTKENISHVMEGEI